jgi:hypothetical protein
MKKLIYTSIAGIISAGIYFAFVHKDEVQPKSFNTPVVSIPVDAVHAHLHKQSQAATQNFHPASPHESTASAETGQFHHSSTQLNMEDAQELIQYPPPVDEKNLAELDSRRQERTKIELEQQLSRLKESGTDGDVYFNKLQPAYNELLDLAKNENASVHVSQLECYTSGCKSTLSYQKTESIDELQMKIMSSPSFSKWGGVIYLSGPIEVQPGVMESTLVFLESITPSNG